MRSFGSSRSNKAVDDNHNAGSSCGVELEKAGINIKSNKVGFSHAKKTSIQNIFSLAPTLIQIAFNCLGNYTTFRKAMVKKACFDALEFVSVEIA